MPDYTDIIASLMGGGLAAGPTAYANSLGMPPIQGAQAGGLPALGGGYGLNLPAIGGAQPVDLPAIGGGYGLNVPAIGGLDTLPISSLWGMRKPEPEPTKEEKAKADAATGKQAIQRPGRTGGPAPADVPAEWRPTLEQAAAQYNVDPNLMAAMLKQENNFQAQGTSPAGARGAAQFMPATARAYNVDVTDPHSSIRGQAAYLADLQRQYNGNQREMLIAYNGGDGAVQAWRRGTPYAESVTYVNKVENYYNQYRAANRAQATTAVENAAVTDATLIAGAAPVNNGYAFPVVGYKGPVPPHHGGVAGGADLMAPEGTPVVAMRAGRVTLAGHNSVGGNAVQIQGDDGLAYYYAHLQYTPTVSTGQQVTAGTPLGAVGRTGNAAGTPPHLHIGIGPSILEGRDRAGGTGGSYAAYPLLQRAFTGSP